MNDRFKFRIFDKETGKYYKSRINKCSGRTLYQHPSSGHCQWVTISTIFAELEQDEKIYTRTGVEPDTIIEQCTGLKDKNGNLIYEGDIVEAHNGAYDIVWSDTECGWALRHRATHRIRAMNCFDFDELSVFSNIHDAMLA